MNSRLRRLVSFLIAFCVVGGGVGTVSASAETTIVVTPPGGAGARTNHFSYVTLSGHTDQDGAQLRLRSELNGTTCNPDGTSGTPEGDPSLTVSPAGDYSKQDQFNPQTEGTYHLCAYLTYPGSAAPDAVGSADVKVGGPLAVLTSPAAAIAGHAANLYGQIYNNDAVNWHFEYGTTPLYGQVTPTQARTPHPDGDGDPIYAELTALEPSTTYHFRLVATDDAGTVTGQDKTFTTNPASSLTMSVPSSRWADESWPVTLSGSAGAPSHYSLFVAPGGTSCGANDTDMVARPGVEGWAFSQSLPPGPFSVTPPVGAHAAGAYVVCAYLEANSRTYGPPEAVASALVTVSNRACPSLDFSVSGASSQSGTKAVFDAVVPADATGTEGTLVRIDQSDGGPYVAEGDPRPGDITITKGGSQKLSVPLNYNKTILPSYDHPVTVTFKIAYMVTSPYEQCVLPDGTVVKDPSKLSDDGYPRLRTAPKTLEVTFRNEGTPPAAAATQEAIGDALTPAGSAAKIGAILKNDYLAQFDAKAPGKVTGAWYFVPKGAHVAGKPKPVVVASGSTTVRSKGRYSLKLRVSKKGRALLKKAKSVKLTTKGTFTPKGGGKKLVVTKTIKLKR